jgi:hypothetical protein
VPFAPRVPPSVRSALVVTSDLVDHLNREVPEGTRPPAEVPAQLTLDRGQLIQESGIPKASQLGECLVVADPQLTRELSAEYDLGFRPGNEYRQL